MTAVEWLAIEYNRIDNKWKNVGQGQKHCAIEKAEALNQAKEMEKQQHEETFEAGYGDLYTSFEQYYSETYKKDKI